ncbi:hypothetical protein QJS10_CPA01g00661 [Acorus calamus]|uniref:Uncharacterized protein n=1 Tax=Acorus calamus TaxID=4465 RepID=A0AAV9FN35_ACOCL|nr:hypothetical protein QJS10_CPA01g00661 [Acorus calamus]
MIKMSINSSGEDDGNEALRKAGLQLGCFTVQIAAATALVPMVDPTAGGGAVACAALAIGLLMVMVMMALKASAVAEWAAVIKWVMWCMAALLFYLVGVSAVYGLLFGGSTTTE